MREIAQLLNQSDLGEVSFEAGKGLRLTIKRKPKFIGAPSSVVADEFESAAEMFVSREAPATEAASDAVTIASPCVGVFHAAKEAVEVGVLVKAKQLIGTVESLKVPNEIYAPDAGVVAQMWVSDGQGVEWGQPLFEIKPGEAPVQHGGG